MWKCLFPGNLELYYISPSFYLPFKFVCLIFFISFNLSQLGHLNTFHSTHCKLSDYYWKAIRTSQILLWKTLAEVSWHLLLSPLYLCLSPLSVFLSFSFSVSLSLCLSLSVSLSLSLTLIHALYVIAYFLFLSHLLLLPLSCYFSPSQSLSCSFFHLLSLLLSIYQTYTCTI